MSGWGSDARPAPGEGACSLITCPVQVLASEKQSQHPAACVAICGCLTCYPQKSGLKKTSSHSSYGWETEQQETPGRWAGCRYKRQAQLRERLPFAKQATGLGHDRPPDSLLLGEFSFQTSLCGYSRSQFLLPAIQASPEPAPFHPQTVSWKMNPAAVAHVVTCCSLWAARHQD